MRSFLSFVVLFAVVQLCLAVEKVPEAKWTVVAATTEWTVKKVDAPPPRNVGLMGGQHASEAAPVSGKNIMIEGRWYKPTPSGSYTECVECNAGQKAEQIPVLPRPVNPPAPIATPIASGPCPCGTGCPCAAPQQMPQYASQYAPHFTHYTPSQTQFGGVCGMRGTGGGCGLFGGSRKGPIRNLLGLIFRCGG